jgi:hypothetical protein
MRRLNQETLLWPNPSLDPHTGLFGCGGVFLALCSLLLLPSRCHPRFSALVFRSALSGLAHNASKWRARNFRRIHEQELSSECRVPATRFPRMM